MGAELWMSRLKWPGMASFYAQKKVPYAPFTGGPTGAFRKSFNAASGGSLGLWYIMSAGHLVPFDNGGMALKMVETILQEQSGL